MHNAPAKGDASESVVTRLPSPYLLFLGDVTDPTYAKTAFGLRDWARERCIGELSCAGGTVTTGLPQLTPAEARARGARSLVIGIANEGGRILESWIPSLVSALEAGLDIVSGMHARLEDTPALKSSAERHGRRLINVRTPPRGIPIGTGAKRQGSGCSPSALIARSARNTPRSRSRVPSARAVSTLIFAPPDRPES